MVPPPLPTPLLLASRDPPHSPRCHSPPLTPHSNEQHPIYDQMTHHGHSVTPGQPHYQVKTTSGEPYTTLSHDAGDATHGHAETSRPLDDSTTASTGNLRPDANPTGSGNHPQEMSTASIKSGVVGFGAGEKQGHAAMPSHNPTEQHLDRDQVVGGGRQGTAGMTEGQDAHSSTGIPSTSEQQPYENTLRQESYTADTNRSFPLVGGVSSQQHNERTPAAVSQSTEHTAPSSHTKINEREPGTKEQELGLREDHGREGLAGAAAAATAIGASHPRSEDRGRDFPGTTVNIPTQLIAIRTDMNTGSDRPYHRRPCHT